MSASSKSLYVDGQYASFTVDHQSSAHGVRLVRARQPQGEYPHPSTPELWVGVQSAGKGPAKVNLGKGYFSTIVEPGDALVRCPNRESDYRFSHSHTFVLVCIEPLQLYKDMASELGVEDLRFPDSHQLLRTPILQPLAQHIWRAVCNGDNALPIQTAVNFLLSVLSGSDTLPPTHGRGGLTPRHQRKLLDFIADNARKGFDLQDLAKLCGLSTFHFSRAFKVSFGTTPHEFITTQKLDEALVLLDQTKKSIDQIAYEAGFTTRQTLFRAFKKRYGMSMSEYRRR